MAKQKQRTVVNTIYGAALQTARQLGLKYTIQNYTTINQALNEPSIMSNLPSPITQGMEITDEYDPQNDTNNLYTKYLVFGNKGHIQIQNSTSAIGYSLPVPHLATDSCVYSLLPLICRSADDDLSISERQQYCLRRTLTISGQLMAFYFGLNIAFDRTTVDQSITQVVNGVSTSSEFIPTFDNLRPTAPTDNTTYAGNYASTAALVQIVFTQQMIEDCMEACRLLYGDENTAIISEIALCHGTSKPVKQRYPTANAQTPLDVAANTFYETVATQPTVHVTTYIPLSFVDQQYSMTLNLGATEPLLGVANK